MRREQHGRGPRKTARRVAVWASVGLLAVLLVGAGPTEYEGEAGVSVVGGNLVSARRRALVAAQRAAVAGAVEGLLAPDQRARLEPRALGAVLGRGESYVTTYRVLDEEQRDGQFHLRVGAVLNLKRLRADLLAALGGEEPGVATAASRPVVAVAAQGSDAGALVSEVVVRLQRAGFAVAVLNEAGQGAAAQAARARAGWLLEISVSSTDGQPVRGIDWPAASARVDLLLRRTGDGRVLGQRHETRWAADRTAGQARAAAALAALEPVLRATLQTLQSHVITPEDAARGVVVHVSGLGSFGQYSGVERILCTALPEVSACRPRRAGAGEVWWTATVAGTPGALAEKLRSQAFDGFELQLRRVDGRSIWLHAQPKEQTDGVTAAP